MCPLSVRVPILFSDSIDRLEQIPSEEKGSTLSACISHVILSASKSDEGSL